MSTTVVWFRTDLRTIDHEPLLKAVSSRQPVRAVYCHEQRFQLKNEFGFLKQRKFRESFIRESLDDLKSQLQEAGIPLDELFGDAADEMAKYAKLHHVTKLYYHDIEGTEERAVEKSVRHNLPTIEIESFIGDHLIHPDDLSFPLNELPKTFTPFRKEVEKQLLVHPAYPAIAHFTKPDTHSKNNWSHEPPSGFRGGTRVGLARLHDFTFGTRAIDSYKETRNGLIAWNDSTKLSPYLSLGCLSPRMIYWHVKRYEKEYSANQSTYWVVFELLWRDYFKLVQRQHKKKIFGSTGLNGRRISTRRDPVDFAKWAEGRTGAPLVDAAMRELKTTGFMSNRCRQNAASYLVHDLNLDWRLGAAWFESWLIDYDTASNYGNWMYVAGVGNDPRAGRKFNVTKQGLDYDRQGDYARLWIPELADKAGDEIYSGLVYY
ncbi:DASH family cryptochrome [Chryseomicrobium sp. FSL W7-1435]|uniref:DASH family cryptochrome n=1 Tax=Chryseomicrobium sp. FSL W7-1435 TaxID=2921704 RepID=UPI00315AB6F0